MISLIRTDSTNSDFIELVKQLDEYLVITDGNEHSFYSQFNKIDAIKQVVIAYQNDKPVGCGAIKDFSATTVEVKRMFTRPEFRGKGVATKILNELEAWTIELGYESCVLETGKRQPDAIALYKKSGYKSTPNYGQYIGMSNSVCFEKVIIH